MDAFSVKQKKIAFKLVNMSGRRIVSSWKVSLKSLWTWVNNSGWWFSFWFLIFCVGFKSWFRSTDQHVSIMHISLSFCGFLVQFLEIVTINIQAIRGSELRSTFGHISPDITYVCVLSHVFPCVHSFKFIYSFTIWCVKFDMCPIETKMQQSYMYVRLLHLYDNKID